MPAFARAEVWSSYACNGGTRLKFFRDVLELQLSKTLSGDDTITLTCPQSDQAVSALVVRRIIRLTYADSSFSEWRIKAIAQRMSDDGLLVVITAASPLLDLADATVIREVSPSGIPSFDIGLVQVSVTEVIDNYILAQPEFQSGGDYDFFARGTIEPTTLFDIQLTKATPLALLRELANAARNATTLQPAEIRVRRNGTTNYLIDVLHEIGSTQPVADLRSGKQILSHQRTRDATEQVSVVIPFGADDGTGEPATVARAAWTLDNGAANVFEITDPEGGPSPVLEDDQLNGLYVVPDGNGAPILITDSAAGSPATVTLASSVGITDGRQYELRASATEELVVEVSSPSALSSYGRKVGPVERSDLNGVRNLLPNPWFRTWPNPSNAPDRWTKVVSAGATFAQNTDPLYTQYAGSSIKVSSGGLVTYAQVTLETDLFYPRPVVGASLYSYRFRIFPKIWTGTARIMCQLTAANGVTVAGQHLWVPTNFPFGGGDALPIGDWFDIGVEGIDLPAAFGSGAKLSMVIMVGDTVTDGSAELYIDAAMVVQSPKSPSFWVEYSSANALWHAGNLALVNNKDGVDAYEIDLVDRFRADGSAFPYEELAIGGTVRDTVAEQNISGQLLRIVGMRQNVLVPKETSIEVATRQKLLADLIGSRASSGGATVAVSGGGGGSQSGGSPPAGGGGSTPPTTNPGSGGNTSGSTSGTPSVSLLKTILADPPGVSTVLEEFPLAETDLGDDGHFQVDLTNVARAYLSGVVINDDGCAGELRVKYRRLSDATWRYLDGAAGPELSMATIGDVQSATSVLVESDARGVRWCKLVAIGGDGVASPEIGHLALHGVPGVVAIGGTSIGDWQQLIADLGGDAVVPFFYDFRYNVTLTGADLDAIDDVRGATGFGPQLGFGNPAPYDPASGVATFNTSNAVTSAAPSSLVNLQNAFTLIYVGSVASGGGGRKFIAAVGTPVTTPTTVLGVRNNAGVIAGEALQGGSRYTADSTVAEHATTPRVCVVSQDGGTGVTFDVPEDTQATATLGGAMSPTSAYISLFEQTDADAGNRGEGQVRALIGVSKVLSAAELAAVMDWAQVYRGAVRA